MKFSQFLEMFPNEEACLDYILQSKYGKGCESCSNEWRRVKKRKAYYCACGQINPLMSTIFARSRTSLHSWFFIMYLFSQSKNGISAKEVQRHTGVTYKCAWRMVHKIRSLMYQKKEKLFGVIEVDETFVGGKAKNRHFKKPKSEALTAVVGILQRNGRVKAFVTDTVDARRLIPMIKENVRKGSYVYTDGWRGYYRLNRLGYRHEKVNHSAYEYARGEVFTSSLEGLWSQVKRTISGTYVSVSRQHLQKYIDERTFFYGNDTPFEDLLSRLVRPLDE